MQRAENNIDARPASYSDETPEAFLGVLSSAIGQGALNSTVAQAVLEALPAAIYATDADGTITFYNKAAAELAGRAPVIGKDKWCVTWKLFTPEGEALPHDQCPMAIALKEQRPVRGVEAIAERPDGKRVPFMPFPTPLFDASGALVGAVNMLVDISQRKDAERTLSAQSRDNERLLAVAHDESGKRQTVEAALTRRIAEQEALYRFTDRLHRSESAPEIYEAALDAIHSALPCDRAAILLFDDSGVMRFVAWRGLSDGYRQAVEGHSPWQPSTRNPEPICFDDIGTADLAQDLRATIRGEGIEALSFVPLMANGKLIGKFMTYCREPHHYSDAEIDLALAIARQLGFSIAKAGAEDARREAEERLRRESEVLQTIFDRSPIMITMRKPGGPLLRLNREFERLTGWSADDAAAVPLAEQCFPDPDYRRRVSEFVASGQDGWMDVTMRARDGAHLETTWANVRLSDGTQVGFGINIAERKRDEMVRQQLASIVESSDDAIISKNLDGTIVSWNKSAERLFGYTAAEAIGRPVLILIPEDRRDEEPAILQRLRRGERVDHFETIRRRKDGSLIDISLTISPIEDDSGRVIGASKIARDIGDRKRAETQRDLLIAELSHRVKNTLSTVISIARQSFANPNAVEARQSFDARIRGLARTHGRLAETNWAGVSLGAVVAGECAPYRRDDGRNIKLSGPTITLNPKSALTIGMALHELATNAAKYGALSSKDGVVTVNWSQDAADGGLLINWTESGGPSVATPTRSGFGRLLLERALAADLKGKVQMEFAPGGLRCMVSIPLSEYAGQGS